MFISKHNFSQNISLAWPMALNAILFQSMVLVDLLLVAPLGEVSIAALGIAGAIVAFFAGIQTALANGSQMIIARATGANDFIKISRDMAAAWVLNVSFSLIVCLALWLSLDSLLALVTQQNEVAQQASLYISIGMISLLFSSLTQVLIAYFNASRQTRIPLYGFMLEIPFNFSISLVLIHGLWGAPELGLQGAALGSLAATLIRVTYLMVQVSRQSQLHIVDGFKYLGRSRIKSHVKEVWPIAANFITLMSGMTLYQMLFAQMSVYAYAAITLVYPWIRIGSQFVSSWAHATAINVSQFIGKKEQHKIPDFISDAVKIIIGLSIALSLVFVVFSLSVQWVYPLLEPETLAMLALIAPIYIVLPIVRTYNTICGNTLRAMGDSYLVLRIHAFSQWAIALPLCALSVYLGAPIYIVFGIVLFEELIKYLPFKRALGKRVASYRESA
ncbi:MATE family efflux transporter [Alginatibacterium sediminis]|uniref:MATE family efflux transporter n=1 Tax=Alginatibacterium sediminis TaxID=2164068 RepID=A0A420EHN6_9ALTE|nr:MATE family efflux transporter [Alginatibacterium sediminis]RKF20167.1 MATE family efflux transporter [Alginatibacterium sediminis]